MNKRKKVLGVFFATIVLFASVLWDCNLNAYAVDNKVRVVDGATAVNMVLPTYGTCFMGNQTVYSDGTGRMRNAAQVFDLMARSGYDLWISANEGEMSVTIENYDNKNADLYNMPDESIKKFFGSIDSQIRQSMDKEGVKVSDITTDIVKYNRNKFLRVKMEADPPYSEVYQYCTLKQNKMITIRLICYNKVADINSFALNPNNIVGNLSIERVAAK